MNLRHPAGYFVAALALATLAGCGGGVSGSSTANPVSAANGCIASSCHGTKASTVTGRAIAEEWKASSHYLLNMAGCTTCHGHAHTNSCSSCHGGSAPQNTAMNLQDAAATCKVCHLGTNVVSALNSNHQPELNSNFSGTTSTIPSALQGYNNSSNPLTTADTTAGWVVMRGTPYESQCIWCHNPHDTHVLPQHTQWASSGHGKTNSSYLRSDLKFRGSPGDFRTEVVGENCVRCHTTTGYVNLVTSGMKNVSPWGKGADGKPISMTKQTLYCNVCHDNGSGKAYGYNLRSIPAQGATGGIRVFYPYSSSVVANTTENENADEIFIPARITGANSYLDFPNVGISDRCILCHAGRANDQLIKQVGSIVNLRRHGRVSTHVAGAGTMFKKLGFEFYSTSHYDQPSGLPYKHDQLGMDNGKGPCVTCHMSSSEQHSFQVVSKDDDNTTITSINTMLCSTCHGTAGIGNVNSNFKGSVATLNTQKTGYTAALKALNAWLAVKSIGSFSTTNWLRSATYAPALTTAGFDQTACKPASAGGTTYSDYVLGIRNMGASINSSYLNNDPGGFIHNDLYVKRIIYDSIDWLDDCKLNGSVGSAIDFTNNALFTSAILLPTDITNAKLYLNAINGRPGGL
ncbi:MAG: hypothetical protein HGB32_06635 [Geobacteraceae bacterium]|nr:hypothetical protein [Geobacteraceae bacterium]NTW79810.1 hypothetical protein [Geobacteraceae bacterium]